MAKRRKRATPRPTQFGVISTWKGRTLVRIFRRENGGASLIAAFVGSDDIVALAIELGVNQQLDPHSMAEGIQRRAKADGFATKWLKQRDVGHG